MVSPLWAPTLPAGSSNVGTLGLQLAAPCGLGTVSHGNNEAPALPGL